MRLRALLPIVLAACAARTRPVPVDAAVDAAAKVGGEADAPALDAVSDPALDAAPPVDCVECVTQCLMDNCPIQLAACIANECGPVGGPDGGGGDAFVPPNCEQIVTCLIVNQCNPLGGPGDPCFDACYGPACASAQATFGPLSECAVDNCVTDCFGCE